MQIKRLIEFSTLNYYISISLRQQDTFVITVLFLFLAFCLFRRQYSLDKSNNYNTNCESSDHVISYQRIQISDG